jgi:hypothetical protein
LRRAPMSNFSFISNVPAVPVGYAVDRDRDQLDDILSERDRN